MNKDFIRIGNQRIRKNTIKKYQPNGELSINLYYNTSRYKIEVEAFKFDTTKERDEMLQTLDTNFGL
jgi:hypothetical protein